MENKLLFLVVLIFGLWFMFSSNGQNAIKKFVGFSNSTSTSSTSDPIKKAIADDEAKIKNVTQDEPQADFGGDIKDPFKEGGSGGITSGGMYYG